MTLSKKNILVIFLLVLFVLIYAGYTLRPQSRPLLPQATRIADISGKYPFYWWITSDALLRFRDPARQDWTFVRTNLKTKTDTPLPALTQLFQKSGGKPETLQVSPFGDWALWKGADAQTFVSRLDGTHHYSVKTGTGENRWMAEGARWIEVMDSGTLFQGGRLYRAEDGKLIRHTALFPSTPSDPKIVNRARVATTLDDHVLVSYWNGAPGQVSYVKIAFMGFGASLMMGGHKEFTAPRESLQGDIIFAPVGRQIAWALEFQEPLPALISALSFSSKLPARVSTGLWVMNADTRAVRDLGALDTDHNDPDRHSGPYNIQWTPDERRLSFIYNDSLWTVP